MSGLWQQHDIERSAGIMFETYGEAEHDRHATLRYNDIASAGSPARPLDFPSPQVYRGERVDLRARDHKSGTIHNLKNVLLRCNKNNNKHSSNRSRPDTAYLLTKKISKTVYGCVNLCIVLKRIDNSLNGNQRNRSTPKQEDRQDNDDEDDSRLVEWESTDHQAAIKISEWKKIHALRGKHLEDPIKEIAAMQLFGNHHPHIIGTSEVLQDDKCIYTVMPYLVGGDLYGRLIEFTGPRSVRADEAGGIGTTGFDETSARIWFRQLLQAVNLLQKKGVCHRDISLENIILDDDDNICLIDPGMSLRVPYTDSETGGVGDVSAGTSRRLMVAQGQGGKLMYAAPEIIAKKTAIDPFATDLWSVGVVLFIMVVGLAPFRWAHHTDKRFASISSGGLKSVVKGLGISISPEVCDLLQGFFWADNQQRLTLAQIMRHPWVQGREMIYRPLTLPSKSATSFTSSKGFSFSPHSLKKKIRGKKQSWNSGSEHSRAKQIDNDSAHGESGHRRVHSLNHDAYR
eukprot:CAMPEP_0116134706 /NCGR_PEP_ID=MMETSP0329-20121206/10794_1 /TAXON_ID=697910 /ORGANISM="Pseudo-nitzschia arenysensis, Strain B593" /LENGTH=513 /DNA_ID=CAMNT_0003629445 /DNA_START=278 /DNA_END=1819 /DNA_ORIENTATION=-